jgi:NitT/TauT family transport system substrate-binding protein
MQRLGLVIGLALTLAACTGPPTAGKPAAPTAPVAPAPPASQAAAAPAAVAPLAPPVALKIGSTQTTGEGGLYLAIEKGYLEEEGLSVELVPFDSGANMVAPLAAGQLDAGVGALSAGLFNALARGIDIVIAGGAGHLAPNFDPSQFMLRKDLAEAGVVRDYADWRGRTVAAGGEGNITTVALGRALERGGLTFQDVNLVILGFADMPGAFANGSIELSFLAEPFVTAAVERDVAVRWRPVSDVLPNHLLTVWMYSRKLAQEQPEVGRRLLVAVSRGARDYMDAMGRNRGRAEAVAALVKHTRVKDPALYDRMQFTAISTSGELNLDALQHDLAWYQANGYVETAPDLARVIDGRFAAYVRERLGPYP